MAPTVLFERSRVARALSDEQRLRAHQLASGVPVTLDPPTFHKTVSAQLEPDDPPLAFELYAGVAHMEIREQIMLGFLDRGVLLHKAEQSFNRYIAACRRVKPREGAPSPTIEERSPGPPKLEIDEMGLTVYRLLPWPENYDADQQRRLMQCAVDDRDLCRLQQRQLKVAREQYHGGQHDWLAWVDKLSRAASIHSEGWLKLERAGKGDQAP
jgi:hypothetical protein